MFQAKWKNNTKKTRATYTTWLDMIRRCHNSECPGYQYYGARNISVCESWRYDYDKFVEDMGLRPAGMSLERIDNSGNYEPSNCKWETSYNQNRNTRRNRWLTFQGRTMVVEDWAKEVGHKASTIQHRLDVQKRPLEEVLAKGSLMPEPEHGTVSRYVSRKCRCDLCRAANARYMRENRDRFPSMSKEYRKAKYHER